MRSTIVLVEDDESIRAMLRYYFDSVGYVLRDYPSGEDLFADVDQTPPSLYLLDVMLPGMDGVEILRRLRDQPSTREVPVIFLTARTSEMDRVRGLDAGADDYVVKPFGVMELHARVKAVLRRTKPSGGVLRVDGVELDPLAHEVRKDGKPVELTYKEFELLRLLLSSRGRVLTRDHILRSVWDCGFVGETRTVDMHIKTLRQKLGDGLIATVRGVGYKIP